MNEKEEQKPEIDKEKKKEPFKGVLVGCVFFSVLVHIGVLFFLNSHFICLYSPYTSLLKSNSNVADSFDLDEYKTKETVLDFIFYVGKKAKSTKKNIAFDKNKPLFEKSSEIKTKPELIKTPYTIDKNIAKPFSHKIEDKEKKQDLIISEVPVKERKKLEKKDTAKQIISHVKSITKNEIKDWQKTTIVADRKVQKEELEVEVDFQFKKADLDKNTEFYSFLERQETQGYLRNTYPKEKTSFFKRENFLLFFPL